MTAYLKGKNGRVDQVERRVSEVKVDGKYIEIYYEGYGCIKGCAYHVDDMEIVSVTK